MIAFISERNRSRRVVLPLFFHANPANVCCFPTRPSLVLLFSSIRQNCVFHSIAPADLCRASLGSRVLQSHACATYCSCHSYRLASCKLVARPSETQIVRRTAVTRSSRNPGSYLLTSVVRGRSARPEPTGHEFSSSGTIGVGGK